MEKDIVERLDRIENLLRELVELARANWQTDDSGRQASGPFAKTSRGQESYEQYMSKVAVVYRPVSSRIAIDEPAPDLSDVWQVGEESDPNARYYESENAEIEADRVPQKGRAAKVKARKRKPG